MTQAVRTRITSAKRARDQSGAAAVEFALVVIPMLLLLIGSIEYGWYFYSTQSASSAARETARRLVVGDCTGAAAQTYAQQQANVNGLTLTYGAPGTGLTDFSGATNGALPAVGDRLRVVVTADAKLITLLPLPAGGTVTKVVNTLVEDTTAATPC